MNSFEIQSMCEELNEQERVAKSSQNMHVLLAKLYMEKRRMQEAYDFARQDPQRWNRAEQIAGELNWMGQTLKKFEEKRSEAEKVLVDFFEDWDG